MFDTYVCDFELEPEVVYKERDIECYSDEHRNYMIAASIFGMLYYLLCSFTFPNMQREDISADFKYDPTYIVILT